MGHRALVAVETCPGRYALYRSQWGGLVLTERSRRPDEALTAALADGTLVSGESSPAGVLDTLASRDDEALFVVGRDDAVERYLVAWLGLVLAAGTVPPGTGRPAALVPISDPKRAQRLDAFVRAAKDVLGDAVDAGVCSPVGGVLVVRELVRRHPDVPPETLWLSP